MNDLLIPTSGEILVNNEKIGVNSKKIISYLPERTYLDKSWSVDKTIEYFAVLENSGLLQAFCKNNGIALSEVERTLSNYSNFEEKNVIVIGISKDSVASHLKFAEKYDLPFVLLSDPELQAIQAYGVWQEKKLYGKVSMGVVRSTYLIDENGMIEKVMPKVKPDTNAEEILAYLAT